MNTKIVMVFGVIGVVAASAVILLIPINEVNAQVVPDLGRSLPSAGFPPNPNAEICGHALHSAIPFC
jgi:hypothetical protein